MTLQFKIQLLHIQNPPVWRTLKVPAHFSFLSFHEVIQAAFGWENEHLFQFSPVLYVGNNSAESDFEISIPDEDLWDGGEIQDARKLKLPVIFTREGQELLYVYDFGDNWEHQITLEKVMAEDSQKADCLAGKGSCPPEDCGGAWRYEEMKKALTDPTHPEHEDTKEWMELNEGEKWDPAAFDLEQANLRVRRIE